MELVELTEILSTSDVGRWYYFENGITPGVGGYFVAPPGLDRVLFLPGELSEYAGGIFFKLDQHLLLARNKSFIIELRPNSAKYRKVNFYFDCYKNYGEIVEFSNEYDSKYISVSETILYAYGKFISKIGSNEREMEVEWRPLKQMDP